MEHHCQTARLQNSSARVLELSEKWLWSSHVILTCKQTRHRFFPIYVCTNQGYICWLGGTNKLCQKNRNHLYIWWSRVQDKSAESFLVCRYTDRQTDTLNTVPAFAIAVGNQIKLQCVSKNRTATIIWHKFTNSQHLLIIFSRERPYSILNW